MCILFARSIAALKARNDRISNQNLSETSQNHVRSFENNVLAHSLIAVPGYTTKKQKQKKNRKLCLLTNRPFAAGVT